MSDPLVSPAEHPTRWLEAHGRLTDELAHLVLEVGQCRVAVLDAHARAWRAGEYLGITERRESCKAATLEWDKELAKVEAEADAKRIELHHVEQQLKFSHLAPKDT